MVVSFFRKVLSPMWEGKKKEGSEPPSSKNT